MCRVCCRGLGIGGWFSTRHSNLWAAHLVFHLVVDAPPEPGHLPHTPPAAKDGSEGAGLAAAGGGGVAARGGDAEGRAADPPDGGGDAGGRYTSYPLALQQRLRCEYVRPLGSESMCAHS